MIVQKVTDVSTSTEVSENEQPVSYCGAIVCLLTLLAKPLRKTIKLL